MFGLQIRVQNFCAGQSGLVARDEVQASALIRANKWKALARLSGCVRGWAPFDRLFGFTFGTFGARATGKGPRKRVVFRGYAVQVRRRASALHGFVLAGAAAGLVLPVPLAAESALRAPAVDGASHRIDIAGRQRMLTQRMTKALCLGLVDGKAVHHKAAALKAADEFEAGLSGLLEGSQALGLRPEQQPDIREGLLEVRALGQGLLPSVRQVMSGDAHSVAVALVLKWNGPVLKKMNGVVGRMESHTAGTVIRSDLAVTLNEAGRQRMLSQRIAKNVCFVASGLSPHTARAALVKDIARFEGTLNGLMQGNPQQQLLKAPTVRIASMLAQVRSGWEDVRPMIANVSDGGAVTAQDLRQIDQHLEGILRSMNAAVGLWAKQAG